MQNFKKVCSSLLDKDYYYLNRLIFKIRSVNWNLNLEFIILNKDILYNPKRSVFEHFYSFYYFKEIFYHFFMISIIYAHTYNREIMMNTGWVFPSYRYLYIMNNIIIV